MIDMCTNQAFTFTLPRTVIDSFLNNQQDALIIQILFCYTKNLHETYQCRMYSRELLMMGKEVARNM